MVIRPDIDTWQKLVSVITATLALGGVLWRPVRKQFQQVSNRTILRVLQRCAKEVRAVMRESVLKDEINTLGRVEQIAETNRDRLEALENSIIQQGKILGLVPELVGQMRGLPNAIEHLSESLEQMAGDIGHIKGQMDERNRREDAERRSGDDRRRRQESPAEDRRHEPDRREAERREED